jgi:hypothetical protein
MDAFEPRTSIPPTREACQSPGQLCLDRERTSRSVAVGTAPAIGAEYAFARAEYRFVAVGAVDARGAAAPRPERTSALAGGDDPARWPLTYDPTGSAPVRALTERESVADRSQYLVSDADGSPDTATVAVTVSGVT